MLPALDREPYYFEPRWIRSQPIRDLNEKSFARSMFEYQHAKGGLYSPLAKAQFLHLVQCPDHAEGADYLYTMPKSLSSDRAETKQSMNPSIIAAHIKIKDIGTTTSSFGRLLRLRLDDNLLSFEIKWLLGILYSTILLAVSYYNTLHWYEYPMMPLAVDYHKPPNWYNNVYPYITTFVFLGWLPILAHCIFYLIRNLLGCYRYLTIYAYESLRSTWSLAEHYCQAWLEWIALLLPELPVTLVKVALLLSKIISMLRGVSTLCHENFREELFLGAYNTCGGGFTVSNSLKVTIEDFTATAWNWWPLAPALCLLQPNQSRIKWYCVSSPDWIGHKYCFSN